MPVSIYGQCADMTRINAIAEKHNIPVIEDGAQSFGATHHGKKSCGLSIIGHPLSSYAVTKYVNELYADVFARAYGLSSTGLRYFNVFGPRQDPNGAYAAVIPQWFGGLIKGETVYINGDGETSRDFCYVENAVQANILAATLGTKTGHEVFNVAYGERTTLIELFQMIRKIVSVKRADGLTVAPGFRDFRVGDVRHSLADISKARSGLGYRPQFSVAGGLEKAAKWYFHCLEY